MIPLSMILSNPTLNPDFKVTILCNVKLLENGTRWSYYNGRPIVSRIWSMERRYIQQPWTTVAPDFKVTPSFDAECLRNGTRHRHSFNVILRPTQQCHFEWPWLTLSDLAKYSMAWSVALSLCDSWASCLNCYRPLKYFESKKSSWKKVILAFLGTEKVATPCNMSVQ